MKNLFLITGILFCLYSCGGDEAEPEPVEPPAPVTNLVENYIENPLDSVLMAEFMALTEGIKNQDSLILQMDSLSISNDSLVQLIATIKDTMSTIFPVLHPAPVVDLTDYNKPPDGNTSRHSYKIFKGSIPDGEESEKKFPKLLIGSYANSNNPKSRLKITSTDITYTKDGDTALFIIASNRFYTQVLDYHILNYEIESGWVTVLMELNGNNLSFKIIGKSADLEDKPTKKELKKYLNENTGSVKSVFLKVG